MQAKKDNSHSNGSGDKRNGWEQGARSQPTAFIVKAAIVLFDRCDEL